jgi:hypothetical protein
MSLSGPELSTYWGEGGGRGGGTHHLPVSRDLPATRDLQQRDLPESLDLPVYLSLETGGFAGRCHDFRRHLRG